SVGGRRNCTAGWDFRNCVGYCEFLPRDFRGWPELHVLCLWVNFGRNGADSIGTRRSDLRVVVLSISTRSIGRFRNRDGSRDAGAGESATDERVFRIVALDVLIQELD